MIHTQHTQINTHTGISTAAQWGGAFTFYTLIPLYIHISIEECQCMCACVCVCVCVAAHWLCIREKAHICMYISILKASCFNERHGIYKNRTHCCTSSTRQCQYILMAWQETAGAHMGVSTRLPHTYRQFWQKAVACSLLLLLLLLLMSLLLLLSLFLLLLLLLGAEKHDTSLFGRNCH